MRRSVTDRPYTVPSPPAPAVPVRGPDTGWTVFFKLLILCGFLLSSASLAQAPVPTVLGAEAVADRLAQGQRALATWQLDEAAAIAAELDQVLPDVPPVQALLGAVRFHQGDYENAVRLLRRAAEGGDAPGLLSLAESTLEETRGFVSMESEHFIVRVPPGKDEVLQPIALEALEAAWSRISDAFDYRPRHKIAVDILHDAKGLASVSSLTVKEIETSGTIALCKYNRLMVTSPKALARGYSWLDTLAHEFLHLIISEKSRNAVPVWLHEGLAKYNETRWRGPPGLALDASSENLLARATKSAKLITFEQMHPSMAKLPSQEDTALAFAEVFSVIEYIEGSVGTVATQGGKRATNVLLEGLRDDLDMDQALERAVGRDLAGLQKDWKLWLKKRPFKLVPGAEPKKLTFVKDARGGGKSDDETEDEAALGEASAKGKEGRRFVRLGNLLRERRRLKAAAVEYEKAVTIVGVTSPALHNRWAGVLIETGDAQKAKGVLDDSVTVFPDDPQTHVLLGRLAMKTEAWAEARAQYERATWENPFIPEVHVALLTIADKTTDAPLKVRAERALGLLMGHRQKAPSSPVYVGDDEPFGTISLRTDPWGKLIVDGTDTGHLTPVVDLKLRPGKHALRVEDQVSGRMDGLVVEVVAGRSQTLSLTLRSLSEDQRRALFVAEEALKPALPTVKKLPTLPPSDVPTPPWVETDDPPPIPVPDDEEP
jgi:tetratricopeptide (TPR) repeat protein